MNTQTTKTAIACPRCAHHREEFKKFFSPDKLGLLIHCTRCKGTDDVSGEKCQADWFVELTTDHLLSLRRRNTHCFYPSYPGEKCVEGEYWYWFYFDNSLLMAELAKRPNRYRAKDRRKNSGVKIPVTNRGKGRRDR